MRSWEFPDSDLVVPTLSDRFGHIIQQSIMSRNVCKVFRNNNWLGIDCYRWRSNGC
jgi:hypothetical protein